MAKEELARECDYILEAQNQKRFRKLIANSEGFYVPIVIDEISSRKVLTTELVAGKTLHLGWCFFFLPFKYWRVESLLVHSLNSSIRYIPLITAQIVMHILVNPSCFNIWKLFNRLVIPSLLNKNALSEISTLQNFKAFMRNLGILLLFT